MSEDREISGSWAWAIVAFLIACVMIFFFSDWDSGWKAVIVSVGASGIVAAYRFLRRRKL